MDFTFAQVQVRDAVVDYSGNCGNMSAAVGPFAVEEGIVSVPQAGEAVVRIHQDTRKILDDPNFRQKQLIDKGYDVVGSSPDEFAAYIKKDSESRARAVKISGAKAE